MQREYDIDRYNINWKTHMNTLMLVYIPMIEDFYWFQVTASDLMVALTESFVVFKQAGLVEDPTYVANGNEIVIF